MKLFNLSGIEVIASDIQKAFEYFLSKRPGIKPGDYIKVNKDVYKVSANNTLLPIKKNKKSRR